MMNRQRVLYDLNKDTTYHVYKNCPLASEIGEDMRRISTEQLAQDKGKSRCPTCVLMDEPFESRPYHLPGGVDVGPTAKIGVALSGGGHRATLFGLGVLMYLAHARRNEDMSVNNDIFEISSVSGGSIANGFIAQSLDYQWATAQDFDKVAGKLVSQIARRGTLFAPWWARIYAGTMATLAIISLCSLASVFVIRGSWSLFWIFIGVGSLVLLAVIGFVAQLRGVVFEKALTKTLFASGDSPTKLSTLARSVLHVICATEVQTGNAAYFSPDFVFCKGFEPRRPDDLHLSRAVRASAALPMAFPPTQIRTKPDQSYQSVWMGNKHKPRGLLLVDGGVRDNLAADWFTDPARRQKFTFLNPDGTPLYESGAFYPTTVLPFPQVDQLVVVSAAANRIKPRRLHAHRPFLGELSSLLKLSDLPYNTREFKSRRALLWQFSSAPNLQAHDGRLRVSGAILHIEESPCDLAEDLLLWLDNWETAPSERSTMLTWAWSERQVSDSATVETVDLLDWYALRDATHRAKSVLKALEDAEKDADLKPIAQEHGRMMSSVLETQELAKEGHASMSKRRLVSMAWKRCAATNAAVSTNLSCLGVETSASLVRHGFVLAMTKLHLLLDYPLCAIPTWEDFRRLADRAE